MFNENDCASHLYLDQPQLSHDHNQAEGQVTSGATRGRGLLTGPFFILMGPFI